MKRDEEDETLGFGSNDSKGAVDLRISFRALFADAVEWPCFSRIKAVGYSR
jgi:hypothetical protein